ncbi:hypothetical protein L195_g056218, partial [Trifolium pratense]
MADNNSLIHELQNDVKSHAAAIESIHTEMQELFRNAEAATAKRFSLFHEALESLMDKPKGESYHGANSSRSAFQ